MAAWGRWGAGAKGLLVSTVLLASMAWGKQIAGVKMPESLELEGRRLALAHMELHEKLWFDVYVWGLYLEEKPQKTAEAIASNGCKRLQFRFLRTIRRDQLVEAFRDGLVEHKALKAPGMRKDLEKLLATLRDVDEGDELVLTYLPNAGLHVAGKASAGILIPGKSFADALFTVWLEDHPVFPE